MGTTYEKIASVTVGAGGASSIDFTSIPSTYTDLQILFSGRQSGAAITASLQLSINGSTANLSAIYLQAGGSSPAGSGTSASNYSGQTPAANATASTFGNATLYIPSYANSSNKSINIETVDETNGTTAYMNMNANLRSTGSAINAISLISGNGSWVQYSSATLYGIKKS